MTPEQSDLIRRAVLVNVAAHLAFTGQQPEPGQSAVYFPHDDPTPAQAAVLARLAGQRHTGATVLCEHAHPDMPLPMAWLAWWPGVIRCPTCAVGAFRRSAGPVGARCSKCQAAGGLTTCSTMLPAVVTVDPPGAVGPVVASMRLCRRCLAGAEMRHVPVPQVVLAGS